MTKPYNPRNPYSKSKYSKKRRLEEAQRISNELKANGQEPTTSDMAGCYIGITILIGIFLLFAYIIGGTEAVIDWFLP